MRKLRVEKEVGASGYRSGSSFFGSSCDSCIEEYKRSRMMASAQSGLDSRRSCDAENRANEA